jgi:hypothetical protein
MNVLRQEPYNLQAGDEVVVRVSAENRNGWSIASPIDTNSNVKIFTVPEQLNQPTVTNKSVSSISLAWPQTADPRPDSYYELFWN